MHTEQHVPQSAPAHDEASWNLARPVAAIVAFMGSAILGVILSRILYEWLFPQWLQLARFGPALALGLVVGLAGLQFWWWLSNRTQAPALAPFLPLFLNLVTLLQPLAPALQSRLLFASSLWLSLLFSLHLLLRRRQTAAKLLFLTGALLPVYVLTMARTVGRADTFEFQVVIPKLGIVHPTGYPLYLLLGKLFTFLPLGSVAWRINFASVAFALGTAFLVFLLIRRLTADEPVALLAVIVFALQPTFWSQAIEAEVYTLHTLFVGTALFLMALALQRLGQEDERRSQSTLLILLAFVLGLGLTNHLTTIILLPGVLLVFFFYRQPLLDLSRRQRLRFLLKSALAFLAPLLLYAYLPLRWAAVNDESMGFARFVDWVIGGRFQGSLHLSAWLNDPSRYALIERLLLAEWQPPVLLFFSLLGIVWLLVKRPRLAVVLLITALGYTFYAISYYVPDLAVFILPVHLIVALFWGVGLARVMHTLAGIRTASAPSFRVLLFVLIAVPLILHASNNWPAVDRSQADGGTEWARGVLTMPLEQGAAILADSEKFPPLYYLQQVTGLRPDLDIIVLPDEATYRSELNARVSAGQTVYLARFIPGLEGRYHLRSVGPLTEVAPTPLETLPPEIQTRRQNFDAINLLGYRLEPFAAVDDTTTAITLYWQAMEDVREVKYVYLRWSGHGYTSQPIPASGQHPAGNYYPTVAWQPGEIVVDYRQLPRPVLNEPQSLALQVAVAPPFSAQDALDWQTVTTVMIEPLRGVELAKSVQMQLGPLLFDGVQFPTQIRPDAEFPLLFSTCGTTVEKLNFTLVPAEVTYKPPVKTQLPLPPADCDESRVYRQNIHINSDTPPGRYNIWAQHWDDAARCRWLALLSAGCSLGTVEISGVPLPEGTTNFADKIALLEIDISDATLQPGDQLTVNLKWQALSPIAENYTVFVQLLDAQDQIVDQVDSWPIQGTFPTGQWQTGEIIRDRYQLQVPGDVAPGSYRLLVGWYLLATQQRLPVLDENGAVIEDKVVVPGLTVE